MLEAHLLFAAAVVAAAWAFARLEIQVEGEEGWAAELPTWHYSAPWIRTILVVREITSDMSVSDVNEALLIDNAFCGTITIEGSGTVAPGNAGMAPVPESSDGC